MKNVITLITNPQTSQLNETIVNNILRALEKQKAKISDVQWLSPNRACDIFFHNLNLDTTHAQVKKQLHETPIDFIIQPIQNRKKQMLISDMDSTIIQQECIDEIADYLGIKEQISSITERAMNGELDFSESLCARVELLAGLPETKLAEVYTNNIEFTSGAMQLVSTMRNNGAYCVLVSGGFTFFSERIAAKAKFDENYANTLEMANYHLTGRVIPPIFDGTSKLDFLRQVASNLKLLKRNILAVGDGANDLLMLKAAGMGIAFHAKDTVRQQIPNTIDHTDLTSLLFIQGYKQEEIING